MRTMLIIGLYMLCFVFATADAAVREIVSLPDGGYGVALHHFDDHIPPLPEGVMLSDKMVTRLYEGELEQRFIERSNVLHSAHIVLWWLPVQISNKVDGHQLSWNDDDGKWNFVEASAQYITHWTGVFFAAIVMLPFLFVLLTAVALDSNKSVRNTAGMLYGFIACVSALYGIASHFSENNFVEYPVTIVAFAFWIVSSIFVSTYVQKHAGDSEGAGLLAFLSTMLLPVGVAIFLHLGTTFQDKTLYIVGIIALPAFLGWLLRVALARVFPATQEDNHTSAT